MDIRYEPGPDFSYKTFYVFLNVTQWFLFECWMCLSLLFIDMMGKFHSNKYLGNFCLIKLMLSSNPLDYNIFSTINII